MPPFYGDTCCLDPHKIALAASNMNSSIGGNMTIGNVTLQFSEHIVYTLAPTRSPTTDPTSDPTNDPTSDPTVDPTADPTRDPTVDPTSDPTNEPTPPTTDPTTDPTFQPTVDPTIDPTKDPTVDPTDDPTSDPTIDPTKDPTTDPTIDPTADPTIDPTDDPTSDPTIDPTSDPTADPTKDPTADPTVDPTSFPTSSPTPGDVYCGELREARTNGDWEYYLHIENTSIVTFDTCSSYLNLFTMRIYFGHHLYAECVECGSICLEESQFRRHMPNGTYLMTIDEKHEFEMICEPEPKPTSEPTEPLTTDSPSSHPSSNPTEDPTTSHPTEQEIVVNVTVGDVSSSTPYLTDPFGRFEASTVVLVDDESNMLGDVVDCYDCFVWQYQSEQESEWNSFDIQGNDDLSVAITKSDDEYTSILVVQSIRRLNSGNCVDDELAENHIFQENMGYRLRMRFVSNTDYYVAEISNEFNITTNRLPSDGVCIIQNVDELLPLEPYNLFCDFWRKEPGTILEYNALIEGVAMSTAGYVDDARQLTGIAPVGNVTITVLVKEQDEYNAITCYEIRETFKSMLEVINTVPDGSNDTTAEVVDSVLDTIDNITSTNSLSENPDMAVSIHTVVEDMFKSNLTTADEAEEIIDDMVVNILETSTVVASSNESGPVNVSGDAIITELATVSSITSNEEIVDVASTTTQLVEEYLPNIFEAVDLFIDTTVTSSPDNASSNASSVSSTAVQDALYSIGEQSQELISNLEATLVNAVATSSDNVSNVTDEEIESVNTLSESLVDYATLAASTALAQSEIGETFNFEEVEVDENGTVVNAKTVAAVKIEADKSSSSSSRPSIGSKTERIELPAAFVSEQEGTFDLAFVSSTRYILLPALI